MRALSGAHAFVERRPHSSYCMTTFSTDTFLQLLDWLNHNTFDGAIIFFECEPSLSRDVFEKFWKRWSDPTQNLALFQGIAIVLGHLGQNCSSRPANLIDPY